MLDSSGSSGQARAKSRSRKSRELDPDFSVQKGVKKKAAAKARKAPFRGERATIVSNSVKHLLEELDGSGVWKKTHFETRALIFRFWFSHELLTQQNELNLYAKEKHVVVMPVKARRFPVSEDVIMQVFKVLAKTLPSISTRTKADVLALIKDFLASGKEFDGVMPDTHIMRSRVRNLRRSLKKPTKIVNDDSLEVFIPNTNKKQVTERTLRYKPTVRSGIKERVDAIMESMVPDQVAPKQTVISNADVISKNPIVEEVTRRPIDRTNVGKVFNTGHKLQSKAAVLKKAPILMSNEDFKYSQAVARTSDLGEKTAPEPPVIMGGGSGYSKFHYPSVKSVSAKRRCRRHKSARLAAGATVLPLTTLQAGGGRSARDHPGIRRSLATIGNHVMVDLVVAPEMEAEETHEDIVNSRYMDNSGLVRAACSWFSAFTASKPLLGGGSGRRSTGSNHTRTSRGKAGQGGGSKGGRPKAITGPSNMNSISKAAVQELLRDVKEPAKGSQGSENGEGEEEEEDEGDEWKRITAAYICADFPEQETTSVGPNIPYFYTDTLGGPVFCGMTAIDTAVRMERKVKDYVQVARSMGPPEQIVANVGTPEFLRQWAAKRGVNLQILNVADDRRIAIYTTAPSLKWVTLGYMENEYMVEKGLIPPGVHEIDGGDDESTESDIGHYVLGIHNSCTVTTETDLTRWSCEAVDWEFTRTHLFRSSAAACNAGFWTGVSWLLKTGLLKIGVSGTAAAVVTSVSTASTAAAFTAIFGCAFLPFFSLRTRLTFIGTPYYPRNDRDSRTFLNRRDKKLYNDSLTMVEQRRYLVLTLPFLMPWRWMLPYEKIVRDHRNDYSVLTERFKDVTLDMQNCVNQGIDPLKSMSTIALQKDTGFDGNRPYDRLNTARAAVIYARSLGAPQKEVDMRGLVQYNHPGRAAIIPEMDAVVANQILGGGGYLKMNHIKNGRWREDNAKRNVVAVAPLGPVITHRGPITAGMICLTDSDTTLAAFMTRAMVKKLYLVDDEKLKDFMDFNMEFFVHMLANTHVTRRGSEKPFHEANIDALWELYRGKKSQEELQRIEERYRRYIAGLMTPKEIRKYKENGFFIKFESNIKAVLDMLFPRPRGIVTMSELMFMCLIQLIYVIHDLYNGPIGDFQVKNKNSQQMGEVVEEFTAMGATVTDGSAFESTCSEHILKLEGFCFKHLLHRAGLDETLRWYEHYETEDKSLTTLWGTLNLYTRWSGRFETSAGNGIANIGFVNYCVVKKNREKARLAMSQMPAPLIKFGGVFEGDDGLFKNYTPIARGQAEGTVENYVTPEIMGELGLKFSTNISGVRSGETDFLRSLWKDGSRYINIGRAMGIFWVKRGHNLRKGKQLWLMRQAALSLHHLSPGHPVLAAVVWRIAEETKHVQPFKNWERYLDKWKERPTGPFPQTYEVDRSMREKIAEGAVGFPPISEADQMTLENRILHDKVIYVGRILDEYEDVWQRVDSASRHNVLSSKHYEEAVMGMSLKFTGKRNHEQLSDLSFLQYPATA